MRPTHAAETADLQHTSGSHGIDKADAYRSSRLAALSARSESSYRVRLAEGAADVRAAQALRFAVFNLELAEGLAQSFDTGLDADPFDAVCDHLLVEHVRGDQDSPSATVVGTYRLQTGKRAGDALGYYSEREFDFAPYEPHRQHILELGRACIHRDHRSFAVLNQLWRGIAVYAHSHGARYLIGCSSLTSQDEALGWAAHRTLQANWAPEQWRTVPRPEFACERRDDAAHLDAPEIPKLLSAYLALGAGICGAPAIDRAFGTIDFLTWLDLRAPAVVAMQRRGRFKA